MENLNHIWDDLSTFEKDDIKSFIALLPCDFVLLYLFFPCFTTLSIFHQCVFALAADVIIYCVFSLFMLSVYISEISIDVAKHIPLEKRGRKSVKIFRMHIFRYNLICIALGIIAGHFFGYTITTLFFAFITLPVLIYLRLCFDLIRTVKKPKKTVGG